MGRRPSKVNERMQDVPLGDIALCTVVEAELRYGAENSDYPARNLIAVEGFVARFVVIPFDRAAAKEYGRIRAALRKTGNMIGGNDLMIAATALARGLILITHNVAEFSRVPGLTVEDWEV